MVWSVQHMEQCGECVAGVGVCPAEQPATQECNNTHQSAERCLAMERGGNSPVAGRIFGSSSKQRHACRLVGRAKKGGVSRLGRQLTADMHTQGWCSTHKPLDSPGKDAPYACLLGLWPHPTLRYLFVVRGGEEGQVMSERQGHSSRRRLVTVADTKAGGCGLASLLTTRTNFQQAAAHSLNWDDAPLHVGQLLEGPHTDVKVVLQGEAREGRGGTSVVGGGR